MAPPRTSAPALAVLLLAMCALPATRAVSTAVEKTLLLRFKALCPAIAISTTSTGQINNNWSSPNFCDWDHISCTDDGKHVRSIAFDFNAAFHNTQLPKTVAGKPNYRRCTLLPELYKFKSLETLIVRNALLKGAVVTGPLPGAPWGAPGSFFSLFSLDLSNNGIKSVIPAGWAQPNPAGFPNLRDLVLDRNKLFGSLPNWGASGDVLPNLEFVDVTFNPDLKGPIPFGWQNVGQFAQATNPVTSNQPLLVVRPNTAIAGCIPPLIPRVNVVRDTVNGFLPTALQTCPTLG